mmetsp:Transcript_94821/g.187829  ORF Transcript_94821/g.187829 Transcript_94821/m.187829 type:complete len:355 (+) Transcript_94821:103-1167(+)
MACEGQDLCHDLQSGLQRKQLQALKSLQHAGVTIEAGPEVMAAISGCMTAAQTDVRAMAVKTIGVLAEPGNQKYIDLVRERLTDDHWFVRRVALESYGRIGLKGDPDVITTVGDMIRDDNAEVRNVALDVFAYLTEKGDKQHALKPLNACLADWNPEIRRTAVLALGLLARRDRMPLLRRSSTMFMNKGVTQQQAPRRKVEQPETDMDTMMLADIRRAIAANLDDKHPEVRRTAAEVLGRCAPTGDSETVANLQKCLTDRVWQVRKTAVEALSRLEDDHEAKVEATLGAMVKDRHPSVRKAANDALSRESTGISLAGSKNDAGWFSSPCCCMVRDEKDFRTWSREGTDCSFQSR